MKKLRILILSFWFFSILPTSFSVTSDGQTLTLDGDYFLGASASSFIGAYSSIIINNSTGATRTATLDGAGHTVYFPYNMVSSTFQFTGDGVVLTVQNVTFQGYNPAAVSYASANAKIIFGDNTKLILDKDISILYTDKTLTCSGNVLLDGQNLTLTASGDSALSMQGAGKTLTIKNTILKPQGPDSICCLDATSKIVLSNSTLELGRDGLAVNNGNLDIDGKVLVRGVDISYTGTQSLALLSKRIQNLGFVPWSSSYAKSGIYSLNLADVYSGNTTFTMVRVSKENKAYYSTSTDPYSVAWTEIVPSAVYKSIDVGDDGQIWVVKTDRTAHRVTRGAPPTLLAATNVSADYVVVGGSTYVFALNSVTGIVYQCNNPTNALDSWTAVTGIYFPRSIAAGNDGTLWFVSVDGRVYKKPYQSTKIEQVFDGVDRDIVKISVSGGQDSNCVVLLSSMPKDGRVLVSQSGGPFRDLGINKVVDVGIGINGSLTMAFDNSAIAENVTFGGQIYSKINSCAAQILTMDRSLTFSSDKYLTIKTGSELELTGDAALRYQPNDLSDNYLQRRHLIFQDSTSNLKMNRSILDCGPLGLTLTTGMMTFSGPTSIFTNSLAGYELEISNQFNFFVGSGSIVNSFGPVSYSKPEKLKSLNSSGVGLVSMNFSESQTLSTLSQPYSTISGLGFTTLNPAHICYRGGIVSNLVTGNANRIAKCNGGGPGGDRGSFELRLNPTNTYAIDSFIAYNQSCREVSIGTDGMVAAVSYNASTYTNGVYINTVLAGNLSTNIGLSGATGAVYASIGASGIIYALKADGTVWKWVSGTSWSSVDLGVGNTGARFIAAGNDGTLWFINQYGNLRVKGMSGVVTSLPGGDGYDLSRVKVAGSYYDFKLVALDRDGNIYKAGPTTSLTKIVVGKIMEVAIAKSGLTFVIFAINTADTEQVKYGGLGYTGILQIQ